MPPAGNGKSNAVPVCSAANERSTSRMSCSGSGRRVSVPSRTSTTPASVSRTQNASRTSRME